MIVSPQHTRSVQAAASRHRRRVESVRVKAVRHLAAHGARADFSSLIRVPTESLECQLRAERERVEGTKVTYTTYTNTPSESLCFNAIQLPSGPQPVVLPAVLERGVYLREVGQAVRVQLCHVGRPVQGPVSLPPFCLPRQIVLQNSRIGDGAVHTVWVHVWAQRKASAGCRTVTRPAIRP